MSNPTIFDLYAVISELSEAIAEIRIYSADETFEQQIHFVQEYVDVGECCLAVELLASMTKDFDFSLSPKSYNLILKVGERMGMSPVFLQALRPPK